MSTSITNLFDTISNSVLYPILQGLLVCVGVVATIVLVKNLVAAFISNGGVEQKNNIKGALMVLGICIVIGFAPGLINWFIGLSGSGMGGVNVG